MKTVVIIQAHVGSTRLHGKVLLDIAGQGMLQRVVQRTKRFKFIDEIIVATSTLAQDDALLPVCEQLQVPVFRGSETNVLDRFTLAARAFAADVCVRITSDCPLIDPDVSSDIIHRFQQADPPVDYASNKIPQSFPRGLDTEVFTFQALERAWRQATQPYERAHVTIYIYEHPEQFKLLSITSDVDRADWRWTVDAPEDLEFVRQVYAKLGPKENFTWLDVVALLEREPALRGINQHIAQKAVRQG